ncbi:uncharacterized protein LOC130975341 [Arachis stenosperma]|uniref:uncharacterized protein LOC130975341 n=1 Tax=Arachis stenosperma TaxID=217475 RepID=UPI0025ABFC9C|nr:uncharacterized protein LOC130975341 [Arachis stenosperma]
MGSKQMTQTIFEYKLKSRNPKTPHFYATIFVGVLIFTFVESMYSNSKIHYFNLKSHVTDTAPQFGYSENNVVMAEEQQSEEAENYDPLIPPDNVSRDERIEWFRRQLPEIEVLKSTTLSQQFHSRVFNFLNKGCPVLHHIIWMSPARSFGKREFLTLDSFFKANPDGCLLIVSRSMDSPRGYAILKPLLDRGFKIQAVTPDLPFLVKDTPAELWLEQINSGTKDPGYVPLSNNLSNLIRLTILYKYGGVYMDTDLIVLRDFSNLRNTIGAQSLDPVTRHWVILNNGVMIFDINHPILLEFMQEFATTFNGNKWGYNGPQLVQRVIERMGGTEGFNLTILPPRAFYPVDRVRAWRFLKKPQDESESRWVENQLNDLSGREIYSVHLWNKRTKDLEIEEGSVVAKLISNHCVVCDGIIKA